MLFSLTWLADYVDLPDAPEAVAARLTGAGHAVDKIEQRDGEVVFEVDITTNRPDCMNHLGLAREIAVLYDRPLRPPATLPAPGEPFELGPLGMAGVEIESPELCPRFAVRVIEGVTVGPSPDWLRLRLEAIGVRPINNIVDATNFVLHELGQPQHAYDLERVPEGRLIVRLARPGETLVTLDGEERLLEPDMLVIADRERAVGVAGVMGGLATEVTEATTTVLLESACFEPRGVRRTSKKLGLHTDASHRFERGVDPQLCARAAERAARLIAELGGGRVLAGGSDLVAVELPRPRPIELRTDRLDAIAGFPIAPADLERWLRGLGFAVELGAGPWLVTPPSWRVWDVERVEDLYEEAMRIHGFDDVPALLPALAGADAPELPAHRRRRLLRRELWACGLCETIHYAFHAPADDDRFAPLVAGGPIRLANPLSDRYSVLRRSLLPDLVETARFNQRRGATEIALFEIGGLFGAGELESVAVVLGGRPTSLWQQRQEHDFFDLQGVLDHLRAVAEVTWTLEPGEIPGLVRGAAAVVLDRDGRRVGHAGRVEDDDLAYPLFAAELLVTALGDLGAGLPEPVVAPSRFPGISSDLTVAHPVDLTWSELEAAVLAVRATGLAPDLKDYELKDRFAGPGVDAGRVHSTLSFHFAAADRSLTQEAVQRQHEALAEALRRRAEERAS
ncbi:MAG TPA: phenylalanine--tRNA ligase subunit beta [Thermoanaerobaculia bacterium]|nr:phenylalanine--tRNA ligase subunit beta [Thermoanaerobaculia bacterium]